MPRRKPRGRPLDGWLIIDKPPGLTSTDVVNRVRRAFDAQKAGHGGTLDPLATGVLPIAFGAATKTVPYVMDGTKLYRFTLRFGEARDTDDADGKVTATSPVRPTDEQIHAALPQIPRRHHAGPAHLLGGENRRRARLRHGARGPPAEPGAASRPRGPLRADRTPRPGHRRLRGRLGQGRLHAQPGPRPRPGLRHSRPYRRAAPPPRRPVHRGPGDTPGQTPRDRRYRAALPRTCCFRSRPRWPTSRRWP